MGHFDPKLSEAPLVFYQKSLWFRKSLCNKEGWDFGTQASMRMELWTFSCCIKGFALHSLPHMILWCARLFEFTAKVVFLWKKKPKLIQFSNYLPKYSFESTSAIHINKPSSSNLFFLLWRPNFFPKSTIQKVFSSLRLHFLSSPAAAPTSS